MNENFEKAIFENWKRKLIELDKVSCEEITLLLLLLTKLSITLFFSLYLSLLYLYYLVRIQFL